jgi:hypothetical protein
MRPHDGVVTTSTVSLGIGTVQASTQPDLLGEVCGDDRGEPLVTGSKGPLMARTREGAGFPALVQGGSCRVRVGR